MVYRNTGLVVLIMSIGGLITSVKVDDQDGITIFSIVSIASVLLTVMAQKEKI